MGFNEDETRDRLFHPYMEEKGYHSASETGPERYDQQGFVEGGIFDGCYMYQDKPLVLVELKAEGKISNSDGSLNQNNLDKIFTEQILPYALSEDFERPTPYLIISDGINFVMYEASTSNVEDPRYQEIGTVIAWNDAIQVSPGRYSQRMIQFSQLIQTIRPFIQTIRDSIKRQIERIKRNESTDLDGNKYPDGTHGALTDLITRLKKSLNTASENKVIEEISATSALNYLNKIIFLKYIEDKDLDSYFRILKEFEVSISMSERDKAFAGIAIAMLKKRHQKKSKTIDEEIFKKFVQELKKKVIDRTSWLQITQAAFSLAEVDFPKVYSSTYFDLFYPTLADVISFVTVLRGYSFEAFSEYQVGILYQEFLRSCQIQQTLGAFYTPLETVNYMVEKLNLSADNSIIDPACGSGHILARCIMKLKTELINSGYTEAEAIQKAISQVWGNDIDPFAVQLSAIRLFFLGTKENIQNNPNVFVFDTLAMEPVSYRDPSDRDLNTTRREYLAGTSHIPLEDYLTSVDSVLSDTQILTSLSEFKRLQFNCFIGNPPYGGKPTTSRRNVYKRIYRGSAEVYGYKLGSNDAFGFFIANAIWRVKNHGRICIIVSDTFLSLRSHFMLRRLILDTCQIEEILLAPIDLFRPMAISRTCVITLVKELCERGYNLRSDDGHWRNKKECDCPSCISRAQNRIKLVDRLKNQSEYYTPPESKIQFIRQKQYEEIDANPFWINIPSRFTQVMALINPERPVKVRDGWRYEELREHIDGGEGISTGNNPSHLVIIRNSPLWMELNEKQSSKLDRFHVLDRSCIIDLSSTDEETLEYYRHNGIDGDQFLVPFERGSYFPYWGREGWYIDWSPDSVNQIKDRARSSRGRSAVFRNPRLYFKRGITTNAHHSKIKATLVENSIVAGNSNLLFGTTLETEFILGYLNSRVSSYFLGKVINTSLGGMSGHATPEDFKRLPILLPETNESQEVFQRIKSQVIDRVNQIIELLQTDPNADYSEEHQEIDSLILEWFGFGDTDQEIIRNYFTQMEEERKLY